jgi:oligopeptide transport system substrate-binding protein
MMFSVMFSRKIAVFGAAMLLLSGLAAQCATAPAVDKVVETAVVTREVLGETVTKVETVEAVKTVEVEKEVIKPVEAAPENPDANRIRLDTVIIAEPPTLDPALSTDSVSVFFVRQMFVSLTDFDEKANVVPALATEWKVSADGLTWTYKLRDDIQWVHRDPTSGKIEAVGPVTAQDVVYGTLRTVDPNTASGYAYVLYVIEGAEEFNMAQPDDENFDKLKAAVGVRALDDKTVQFTLKAPAAYFPSITAMWVTFPQPQATIEKYGTDWTEAGLIVTNGPYTLREWRHGAAMMLEKNPLWINARDVQIELYGGPIVQEASTAIAMYEHNEIDMMSDPPGATVPLPDIDRIKSDPQLSKELYVAQQPCTYYYGFVDTKPPFDNVNVRKAFAMAIDRQDLIDNVLKGGQLPAHSFTSPGNFGSVADDKDIGAFLIKASYGDQVKEAQKLLADAGYPEGQGLNLVLMHNTLETHAQIAQAIQAMWAEAFPKAKVTIENQEWAVYLQTLSPDAPDADKPDIYYMGWCADYPDANNWLNEVFNSKSGQNYAKYNDPAFDKLVEQAAFEPDQARRQELYRQAEDIFIDKDVAIAPIYYFTYVRLYKPWLTKVVVSPFTGDPIAEWRIDWAAKMKARGL